MTREYYSGWVEFIDQEFDVAEAKYSEEEFYEVKIFDSRIFSYDSPGGEYAQYLNSRIRLLLPKKIKEYAEIGAPIQSFSFPKNRNESSDYEVYIDNDRVGIKILRPRDPVTIFRDSVNSNINID